MSIATVDNYFVHYEVVGRGSPTIFLHGWLGSWRYWWSSMQAISRRSRAFALDFWGFGDSSKEQVYYGLDHFVRLLDQFVDGLGIVQPAALIGHSMGAEAALRYSYLRPDRVKKLVLVSHPVKGNQINARLIDQSLKSLDQRLQSRLDLTPEVEQELRKADPLAISQTVQTMLALDYSGGLIEPPCPVLWIHGENDAVVLPPSEDQDTIQNLSSPVQLVMLADAGHFPMLDQPAVFNRLLLDFESAEDPIDIRPKEYWQRRTR